MAALSLLAVLGAGCASGEAPAGVEDPVTPSATSRSTVGSGESAESRAPGAPVVADIVSGTAAGGQVAAAVDLSRGAGLERLLRGIGGELAGRVRSAVAGIDPAPGQRLVGQVLDIGCGVPDGVRPRSGGAALGFAPTYSVKPPTECFAPVTSIALVLLPTG